MSITYCPCGHEEDNDQHACPVTHKRLRGTLSLAEEGLANYAQEVEHLRAYQQQMNDILKDNERLRSTLAHRLQELYDAKWLIRNGEKHFGSLWREATTDDILAITRRAEPQTCDESPKQALTVTSDGDSIASSSKEIAP